MGLFCSKKTKKFTSVHYNQIKSFNDITLIENKDDEIITVTSNAFNGSSTNEGADDCHWFCGKRYSDYNDSNRIDIIRFMQKMYLKYCKMNGSIVLGKYNDENKLKGVVVINRLNKGYKTDFFQIYKYIKIMMKLKNEMPPIMKNNNNAYPSFVNKNLQQLGNIETKFHSRYGKVPHYQIQIAAVDPDTQGKGYSSILLRRVNELADAENMSCFLFTAGTKGDDSLKIKIYNRFGYEKVDEETIINSDGMSVTCFAMVRKPICKKIN